MLVRRGAAVAVVLAMFVAGCSDDEPKADPKPRPTQTVSLSPSPTAQPWEEKTLAGAEAFVEHFIETFNAMMVTGQTDALKALSGPECETCSNFVRVTEEWYAAGGHVESDGWKITHASPSWKAGSKASAFVAFRVLQPAEVVYKTASAEPERADEQRRSYSASVDWRAGAWVMTRLDLLQ